MDIPCISIIMSLYGLFSCTHLFLAAIHSIIRYQVGLCTTISEFSPPHRGGVYPLSFSGYSNAGHHSGVFVDRIENVTFTAQNVTRFTCQFMIIACQCMKRDIFIQFSTQAFQYMLKVLVIYSRKSSKLFS